MASVASDVSMSVLWVVDTAVEGAEKVGTAVVVAAQEMVVEVVVEVLMQAVAVEMTVEAVMESNSVAARLQ